jgi:hypothetical protein
MPMKLPDNHQRGINAIAVVIEKKLEAMQNALNRNKTNTRGIAMSYINDVSEENRNLILKDIDDLYHLLEKFCLRYQIPKQDYSLKRELNTSATFLWVDLADANGKSLKGFGKLDPEIIKEYDTFINQMIEKTNKIAHITN